MNRSTAVRLPQESPSGSTPNSEIGLRCFVAQVSEPAVSPTSQSAGLGHFGAVGIVPALADLLIRDTAGWEACAIFPRQPLTFPSRNSVQPHLPEFGAHCDLNLKIENRGGKPRMARIARISSLSHPALGDPTGCEVCVRAFNRCGRAGSTGRWQRRCGRIAPSPHPTPVWFRRACLCPR